jgi:predicted enzyme related to lactoylglutathione lyase
MPPGSEGKYFIARLRGGDVAAVGSIPEAAPPIAMWNTYVWVESADDTAAKVRDAGGGVVMEPFEVMDAGRMAVFADPEGAAFCPWQAQDNKGARIVNEPGSLNFNGLNTRDVQGAKSFYGSVFGWTTLALDGGADMWTLPGYGDHLERDNPDLRKQTAEADAPEGFEDVVASINLIPDDQPDTPAHWSVTLSGRRRRRHGGQGHRARREGDRPALRRPVGPDNDQQRPAGRDVHRKQVRAGEQGPRQPGEHWARRRLARLVVHRRLGGPQDPVPRRASIDGSPCLRRTTRRWGRSGSPARDGHGQTHGPCGAASFGSPCQRWPSGHRTSQQISTFAPASSRTDRRLWHTSATRR